jgi:hypothetical protein
MIPFLIRAVALTLTVLAAALILITVGEWLT